ncbi:MAG: hypothetical protein GXP25_00465 [Planctomycetes bacterium]|nr:hypothetical protein [Planctomycetota bacterium]
MHKRLMVLWVLVLAVGCEEEMRKAPAKQATPPAPAVTIISKKDDFAQGTMRGLELLPEGTLVLKRKNLLENSSFESDDPGTQWIRDGMAYSWGLWGKDRAYHTYSDRSVPYLPNEATHGRRSQRIKLKAKGKTELLLIQEVRNLKPELPYSFAADVKLDDPKKLEASLSMNFYAGQKWHSAKSSEWKSPTTFTRMSVTAIMPKEADRIRCIVTFRPKVANAEGTVWVDAAQLEQSPKPTAYCAGYSTEPGEFVSAPIDLSKAGAPYKLTWIAAQPAVTGLTFQLRTADTKEGLASATWHGPTNAEAYATVIESGPNLMTNPSVEIDADGDGAPDQVRTIGYGENEHKFEVVADAHSGKKALKVQITKYDSGNRRWELGRDGPFEKDTEYAFSLWHKENSPQTSVSMSVAIEDAKGTMHWGRFGANKEASTTWKRDVLSFRTPKDLDIKRLYLELNLSGVGWTITDDYSLRRVVGSDAWPVHPVHRGAKWAQWRAVFSTSDSAYTPKLFQTELTCGPSVPEVRWLNVTAEDGRQKYCFNPGQTAVFKPQVLDYTGAKHIERVGLTLVDPLGKVRKKIDLPRKESISDIEAFFSGRYQFADDAPLGEWQAVVEVETDAGRVCREMVVLKVRKPYTNPPQKMIVGALVTDYGFRNYKGKGLQNLLDKYRSAKGLEIWKESISWQRLEPMPGEFNREMIEGLRAFIAAAHAAGAKAQIGIQQQVFPEWVNNGDWDNINRYRYPPTMHLARTWMHLAKILKECPGFESYLVINEENHVRDAEAYLRSTAKVQSIIRAVDPDPNHRITIRPNTREPYIRTRIASDGAQDYDYGSGGYPTSASWYYKDYANPVSQTSCLRMATFHASPLVFGGPGGIGEIGFFVRKPKDQFGDEERLAGFQRAMTIAYEMGMDEFSLWGGGFSFDKLDVYYPKLLAFRDELLKKPRPEGFDVRLVLDTGERMYQNVPHSSSRLDMTKQPYAAVFRYLDGKGYVWFYTTEEAMAIQTVGAKATITLAEFRDKSAADQEAVLAEKLRGVRPSGTPLPWPANAE